MTALKKNWINVFLIDSTNENDVGTIIFKRGKEGVKALTAFQVQGKIFKLEDHNNLFTFNSDLRSTLLPGIVICSFV